MLQCSRSKRRCARSLSAWTALFAAWNQTAINRCFVPRDLNFPCTTWQFAFESMGFDSFLGNPQAVAAVREMVASGRVPGALLFAGPEGVGKKTLALMLAKALVCERGAADFCDQCARCRKAEQMFAAAREDLARRREIKETARRVGGLVYFDLQIIEPLTKFILAEQIRQLRAVAYTRPFEFPRRFFILEKPKRFIGRPWTCCS